MQTYGSVFAHDVFIKWFILNKVCISETIFENEFQILFYKIFSLVLKDYFSNHIAILHYANKALFDQFIKFYLKIKFIMKI
jgi:hypothetical protein